MSPGDTDARTPILYLAPWVDLGGSDEATLEWFRCIDRSRWAPSLITTQPSPNRLLHEVEPYASEIWNLPDLLPGHRFPSFILDFIESRGVRFVHIMNSRLGFTLLPDIAIVPDPPMVAVQLHVEDPQGSGYAHYAASRYDEFVDGYSVTDERVAQTLADYGVRPSKVETIPPESAALHGEFYEGLVPSHWRPELPSCDIGPAPPPPPESPAAPLSRSSPRERTVGVVVPCYGYGQYLAQCIASIKDQTLTPTAIVLVDDCSRDLETVEALALLDSDPDVTVVRLDDGRGPGAARNRGIAELPDCSYVLPLDADDLLLPKALEEMVAQIESAPPEIGFIYPNAQHIGTRRDYVVSPAYNLWTLMGGNYCPAPALFDKRVFDLGVAYPDDLLALHEDWDLVLDLAALGILGERALTPTFLYRKAGYGRMESIQSQGGAMATFHRERHQVLYRNRGVIKGRWAPALSIVLVDEPGRAWQETDLHDMATQTCPDHEIVAARPLADGVRGAEAADRPAAARLQACVAAARGRWVCLLTPRARSALADRTLVERLLRCQWDGERAAAIVLAPPPGPARAAFSQLDDDERLAAAPAGVLFERPPEQHMRPIRLARHSRPLDDIVFQLQAHGPVQWRALPSESRYARPRDRREPVRRAADPAVDASTATILALGRPQPRNTADNLTQRAIAWQEPLLPGFDHGPRRIDPHGIWAPHESLRLCRHRAVDRAEWLVTDSPHPPEGFRLEFDLGVVQQHAFSGTRQLIAIDGTFRLLSGVPVDGGRRLGHIEQTPLPLLVPLELRSVHGSGQHVLVAGDDDPLTERTDPIATLGWIESFPVQPKDNRVHLGPWGVVPLRRWVDHDRWLHRYRTTAPGDECESVVVASLLPDPDTDLIPLVHRRDGRLETALATPSRATINPQRAARWVTAPLAWGESAKPPSWAKRAAMSRLRQLARRRLRPAIAAFGQTRTLGWLRATPAPGFGPLVSATHPVTGDQFVTRSTLEATDLGFHVDGVLGYALAAGADESTVVSATTVLWGNRFGKGRRYEEAADAPAARQPVGV